MRPSRKNGARAVAVPGTRVEGTVKHHLPNAAKTTKTHPCRTAGPGSLRHIFKKTFFCSRLSKAELTPPACFVNEIKYPQFNHLASAEEVFFNRRLHARRERRRSCPASLAAGRPPDALGGSGRRAAAVGMREGARTGKLSSARKLRKTAQSLNAEGGRAPCAARACASRGKNRARPHATPAER